MPICPQAHFPCIQKNTLEGKDIRKRSYAGEKRDTPKCARRNTLVCVKEIKEKEK